VEKKPRIREISSLTEIVSDGAEFSLRMPTGSSRESVRDGKEHAGAKREEKASACSAGNDVGSRPVEVWNERCAIGAE
jgi:hypothetical protein